MFPLLIRERPRVRIANEFKGDGMPSIDASASTTISSPPEAVFLMLTNPARMAEWMNGVQSAEWEEGSGPRTGGKFDMKYKYSRKIHDIKMEITAIQPGSLLEYKTIEGPYPIQARFTLRPAGDGTAITYGQTAYSDSFLAALGFVVTSWIAKPMVRRVLRKDLEKLSAIVQEKNQQPADSQD